jgi:hypothetical protein
LHPVQACNFTVTVEIHNQSQKARLSLQRHIRIS